MREKSRHCDTLVWRALMPIITTAIIKFRPNRTIETMLDVYGKVRMLARCQINNLSRC